ncbi:response regulator [Longimycelium tulufanense]|uniref:Response regulator n=1 Tax=Longimycelium tulufanense TaxID=907463 RepID=A0A8J3CDL0_9PSEU|nr:response regulator [Longimycelium tulufanense]GGM63788.1 response regulator [Longimycelium tulufanense]
MGDAALLITAIGSLMWPLIALYALTSLRPYLVRVLRSAETRQLDFEIGGQRITFRELSSQQNELIQDLQRQVSTLRKALETAPHAVPGPPPVTEGEPTRPPEPVPAADREREPFAVLWVDDHPESKALLMEQLRNNGVRVDLVGTTSEAMGTLSRRRYRLIVTDMGRVESGTYQPEAGLELLREVRDVGVDIPVVVFCVPKNFAQASFRARELGAIGVTSSAVELTDYFQRFGLL